MPNLDFDGPDDYEDARPPLGPRKMRGATTNERLDDNFAGDPIGPRQTLTVGAAAVDLDVPAYARSATVSIETAAVRITFDGTVPTAAVGMPVAVGTVLQLTGLATLKAAQLIRSGAADGTAQVEYFS